MIAVYTLSGPRFNIALFDRCFFSCIRREDMAHNVSISPGVSLPRNPSSRRLYQVQILFLAHVPGQIPGNETTRPGCVRECVCLCASLCFGSFRSSDRKRSVRRDGYSKKGVAAGGWGGEHWDAKMKGKLRRTRSVAAESAHLHGWRCGAGLLEYTHTHCMGAQYTEKIKFREL